MCSSRLPSDIQLEMGRRDVAVSVRKVTYKLT